MPTGAVKKLDKPGRRKSFRLVLRCDRPSWDFTLSRSRRNETASLRPRDGQLFVVDRCFSSGTVRCPPPDPLLLLSNEFHCVKRQRIVSLRPLVYGYLFLLSSEL